MTNYNKYIKIFDCKNDREKIDEHYAYCYKNKIPFIRIEKTGEYATIKVDGITMPPDIENHYDVVSERFGDWIDDALRNDFLKKGEFNTCGIYSEMTVKKQCADHYAETAFNIYVDLWKSLK